MPAPIEVLLREAGWIRRLAIQLVGDRSQAEDLAQETWVRILAQPPRVDTPVRGWIATVMRNLLRHEARTEARRASRELGAARDEAVDGSVLDRVASQRAIADAVLSLEEPYRTAILLRFFEGEPPRRIAARLGIPVATVKTRLARGLDRLRTRMPERLGPSWGLALAALSRGPSAPPAVPWPDLTLLFAMNVKLLSGLVLFAAGAAWWVWSEARPAVDGAPRAAALVSAEPMAPSAAAPTGAGMSADPVGVTPRSEVTAPAATPAADEAVKATTASVRGRVLDPRGVGVAGVLVGVVARAREAASGAEPTGVRTEPDGSFAVDAVLGGDLVVLDERFATVLAGRSSAGTQDAIVVVAPRVAVQGHVADALGVPVANASLRLTLPRDFRGRLGVVVDESSELTWSCASDASGAFAFDEAPAIPGATLLVSADGLVAHDEDAPTTDRTDLQIVLQAPDQAERELHGIVVDAAGVPVPGAIVSMGIDVTHTDERGEFAFPLDAETSFNQSVSRFLTVDEAVLIAVKAGHQPGRLVAEERDAEERPVWPAPPIVRLGGEPLSIAGLVVDEDGEPQAGVRVWIADPTFLGGLGDPATQRFPELTHVEAVLDGRDPGWAWVDTDAAGAFRIDGLIERSYAVQTMDPQTLLRSEQPDVPAGSNGVRLVLPRQEAFARLRGRVVDGSGAPIGGVSVTPMCDAFLMRYGERVIGTQHETVEGTVTDDDGRFVLEDVPRTLVYLRLDATDAIPLEWGRRIAGGLAEMVGENPEEFLITMGRRCNFQVELASADEADAVEVLDGLDERLVVSEFLGRSRREGRRHPLIEGRSNPLAVADQARFLVLMRDGEEVRRVPLRLTPGEHTVVRP
ncbi:MAG: sigma-70 family RNA polymerase sigma factor [Planctomycetota bacterium]